MEEKTTQRTTVDMPTDMYRRIKVICAGSGITMREFIISLLSGAIKEIDRGQRDQIDKQ